MCFRLAHELPLLQAELRYRDSDAPGGIGFAAKSICPRSDYMGAHSFSLCGMDSFCRSYGIIAGRRSPFWSASTEMERSLLASRNRLAIVSFADRAQGEGSAPCFPSRASSKQA